MDLNPTLELAQIPADGRWRARLVTRRDGRRELLLPPRLGAALLDVQAGIRTAATLGAGPVGRLLDHEVLVKDVVPPPVYECALRTCADGKSLVADGSGLAVNPAFGLRARGGRTELAEWNADGVVVAEYVVDPAVASAFLAVRDGAGVDAAAVAPLRQVGAVGPVFTAAGSSLAAQEFHARGYIVIDSFARPRELAALQRYCDAVYERGFLDGDRDDDGRRRRHVFNDPNLGWLLARAASYVDALVPEPIAATYSFLAFYEGGGRLPRHRDKAHCQFTISLAVRTPGATGGSDGGWPLLLGNGEAVCWNEGQAVLFDGRALAHERPALPDDAAATYIVLHVQPDPDQMP